MPTRRWTGHGTKSKREERAQNDGRRAGHGTKIKREERAQNDRRRTGHGTKSKREERAQNDRRRTGHGTKKQMRGTSAKRKEKDRRARLAELRKARRSLACRDARPGFAIDLLAPVLLDRLRRELHLHEFDRAALDLALRGFPITVLRPRLPIPRVVLLLRLPPLHLDHRVGLGSIHTTERRGGGGQGSTGFGTHLALLGAAGCS